MALPIWPQETAEFCSTEPSTDFPTTADWVKLAIPALALVSGTYTRFGNQIKAEKWADLCECVGVTGGYCTIQDIELTSSNVGPNATSAMGTNSRYYPPSSQFSIPAGQHHMRLTFRGPMTWTGSFEVYSGTALPELTWSAHLSVPGEANTPSPVDLVFEYDLPTSITGANLVIRRETGTGPVPQWVEFAFKNRASQSTCSPTGTTYNPPPPADPPTGFPTPPASSCSTTADLCALITTLSKKMDWMRAQVDLIQRQKVPFGSIAGEVHSGLTGSGTLAVQGILGLSVDPTGWPSYLGQDPTTPPAYFDFGRVAWGDANGWIGSQMIRHNPTLILPIDGLVTSVGYTFGEGVTATITELTREP